MRVLHPIWLLGFAILIAPATYAGDDSDSSWTRFRGPGGHGVVTGGNLPDRITEEHIAWRAELPGGGHSSPVIYGDGIFLTWIDRAAGVRTLGCLNAADGSIRWQYQNQFTEYEHHRDNSFASSTPAVDERGVYCYWSSGDEQIVLAVSHDGEKMWQRSLGTFAAQWGTGSSPVIVDGVLIVTNDNEGETSFLAGLDPATGEDRWRRKRTSSRSSYATPLVIDDAHGEKAVVIASTSHGLTCLKPADGSLLWEVDGLFNERCVGSPVLVGDLIYQCAGSGNAGKEAVAISLPRDGETSTPTIAHKPSGGLPYVTTPIAVGDWVFFWTDSGILSCLNAADGTVLWKERIGERYYGSPICIDDRLYCMSRDGNLHVIAASSNFQPLYTFALGEGSSATPALARGVLYLRTENQLIAVRGSSPD